MKKIYVASNPTDAHLLTGFLEGENIRTEVRGEFIFGVRGEVPITTDTCPSVWVLDDSDYDEAIRFVTAFADLDKTASQASGAWRCACDEENEAQFTECWSCGKPRL